MEEEEKKLHFVQSYNVRLKRYILQLNWGFWYDLKSSEREKKKLSFIHYLIWGLRNKNGWKVLNDVSMKKKKKSETEKRNMFDYFDRYHIELKCHDSQFFSINRLILSTNLCNGGCEVCLYLTKNRNTEKSGPMSFFIWFIIDTQKSIMDFSWANRLDKREKGGSKS